MHLDCFLHFLKYSLCVSQKFSWFFEHLTFKYSSLKSERSQKIPRNNPRKDINFSKLLYKMSTKEEEKRKETLVHSEEEDTTIQSFCKSTSFFCRPNLCS